MYTLSSIKYNPVQNKLWYNVAVPPTAEKKDQPLALRVPESLLNRLAEISVLEDRPLGYVARELLYICRMENYVTIHRHEKPRSSPRSPAAKRKRMFGGISNAKY
jgi:hypothetical protein